MKGTWGRASVLLVAATVAFACGDDNASSLGEDGNSNSDGNGGGSSSEGSGAANSGGSSSVTQPGVGGSEQGPIFETDIVPIFENSCGTGDDKCHSKKAFGADSSAGCIGWLSLENNPLGSVTPDGDPTGCPDMDLYERLMLTSAS